MIPIKHYKLSCYFVSTYKKKIDSLLITNNGFELVEFYRKTFGLKFSCLNEKNFKLYICNDQNITIYNGSLDGYTGGLLKYEQGFDKKNNELCISYCNNDSFVNATLKLTDYNGILKNRNTNSATNWYSIFRSKDPCKLKNFFSTLGTWIEEQHINGPTHYHLDNSDGEIYEIYPMLKISIQKMQFFIPRKDGSNFENFIYDIDGRGVKTLKSNYQ